MACGIQAEDRQGVRRFFALTTLPIGAVVVSGNQSLPAEEVAQQAALAKHHAKMSGDGYFECSLTKPPGAGVSVCAASPRDRSARNSGRFLA